jgi:hypothetical protein
MAYSSHQMLSTSLEDLNKSLNLDNVASLYLSSPFGRDVVTLIWPTVPAITAENPKTEPGIKVYGLRQLGPGPMKWITFDLAHPAHLIEVGDRIFQVQLTSIDDKTTAQSPRMEYSFAISEVEPTAENKANAITQNESSATPSDTP